MEKEFKPHDWPDEPLSIDGLKNSILRIERLIELRAPRSIMNGELQLMEERLKFLRLRLMGNNVSDY